MKWFVLTLAAVLAMTGISFGQVTLDYVTNPDPAEGLKSYTVQATGVGINVLGKFLITGDVYQVWTAPDTQSEWINNTDDNTPGDAKDSYIIFGEERLPDLPGAFPGNPHGDSVTLETIHGGGTEGLGTLNNYNPDTDLADAYLVFGTPSSVEETYDLLKLVVPESECVIVELEVISAEYNPDTGFYTIITQHQFFGEDALKVPEPSILALLGLGVLGLLIPRFRRN